MVEYIKHDDSRVEPAVQGEEEKVQELIKVINRMQDHNFSHHRHGFRGTHVKTQAIVKGELTIVSNLPEHLAQGLFNKAKTHPIAIRFANEPSFLQDDRAPGPRGCGMKVFNVEGQFLDSTGSSTHTQDFTFNNAPILELTDLPTTLEIIKLRESHFDDAEGLKVELKKRKDAELQFAPAQLPNQHFLSYTMYSQSAYRYGEYVAKYALFPTGELQRRLEESHKITDSSDREQHSHWLRTFFATHAAEYDFRVQLLVDPSEQPVEDCSREWDESKYPFETVGKVRIPPQESFDPKRRSFWDDRMKLSVWTNALEAHRPLGSANRLRRGLYAGSAAKRAEVNSQEVVFVESIDQIP